MTYKYFMWGPPLINDKLDDEFRKGMIARGLRLNNDFRSGLAGHIDKENEYTLDSDKKYFVENMQKHIDNFKNHSEFYLNKPMFEELKLDKLWINFMKKGEFNPIHYHGGDISFVLYLDVPKEINEERLISTDAGGGPGGIYFTYGDPANKWSSHMQKFRPETGDMFMFPASLGHMVAPFRSDVTRISVSGNFEVIR